MAIENPYTEVAGIQNPKMFFGRRTEIDFLTDVLRPTAAQCVSLVGQRKIGKSSLILEAGRRLKAKYSRGARVVYFDCQRYGQSLDSTDAFWNDLMSATRLASESGEPHEQRNRRTKGPTKELTFTEMLGEMDAAGVLTVVFFDEFEKAIAAPALIHGGVFGVLRSLAQQFGGFSWVTSTRGYLHELFEESFAANDIDPIQRKRESDFFNIAPVRVVGLFTQEEAAELLCRPVEESGMPFTPVECQQIRSFGGRFPYFLQRAAFWSFNEKVRGAAARGNIISTCKKEAVPIWEKYLEGIPEGSLEVAGQVSRGLHVTTSPALERLKDLSLIEFDREKGYYVPFSEVFAAFLAEHAKELRRSEQLQNQEENKKRSRSSVLVRWIVGSLTIMLASSWIAGYIQWKTGWGGHWSQIRLTVRVVAATIGTIVAALLVREKSEWELAGKAAVVAAVVLGYMYWISDKRIQIASMASCAVLIGTAVVTLFRGKQVSS